MTHVLFKNYYFSGSPVQTGRGTTSSNRFLSSESSYNLRQQHMSSGIFPPISVKNENLKRKFPGLERRRFALPYNFVTLHTSTSVDGCNEVFSNPGSSAGNSKNQSFVSLNKKIGFFNLPNQEEGHSTGDELSNVGGLLSDSSSESSSSDTEDNQQLTIPTASQQSSASVGGATRKVHSVADMDKLRRNTSTPSKLLRSEQAMSGKTGCKLIQICPRHFEQV